MHAQQVCVYVFFRNIKSRKTGKESSTDSCCSGVLHMIIAHAIHIHSMYPLNIKSTEIHKYRHTYALTGLRPLVI